MAAPLSGSAEGRHQVQKVNMKAHYLGHVVFYVKNLQQSLSFYRDLLGFKEIGRVFNGTAAALTSGRTHHELLLIQVGDAPGPPPRALSYRYQSRQ
jgi:catechol 2,3-dioxygenase-like lactoylglutathione lyase family enzyme